MIQERRGLSLMNRKNLISIKDISIAIGMFAAATVLGWGVRKLGFTEANIVIIYILAVLLVARFTEGYRYGMGVSIVCILGFNYFFTEPYHTLNVYDPNYFVTFTIMAITSMITSTLTSKEKLYTKEVEEREREGKTLYALTNQLSDTDNIEKMIQITLSSMYELFHIEVGFIYFECKGKQVFIQQRGNYQIHRSSEETKALWETLQNIRTEYIEEHDYIDLPINGNECLLGALRLERTKGIQLLQEKNRLIHAIVENVGMALDRMVATTERVQARETIMKERYRANLLRAISHDLRTPLAGMMGTAELLMDMTHVDDKRYPMIWGIYQDADWLHSLVENILSLTRLQDGKMAVKKELEALEEVIATAVNHIEKMYKGREVQVFLPDDFKLVPMDARLIGQVITNLLDNAIKHTQEDEHIKITVSYNEKDAIVCVEDEGEGIDEKDESNIFQMFYTTQTKSADAKKGIGLGLTICETVIKAHGGTIQGTNRKDRTGAQFIFKLPLKEGEKNV